MSHPFPTPDTDQAWNYLKLLDPDAAGFTYQTFNDKKTRKNLARLAHLPELAEDFPELQQQGAGIFVTISETDGSGGRESENIVRVRAVWCELDQERLKPFPIPPSIVVQSSPGKFHLYWLVFDSWPADKRGRADFAGVMRRMLEYGHDKSASDITRVLRMPGYWHVKYEPQMVRLIDSNGTSYTRAEILAAFPPIAEERPKPNGHAPPPPRSDEAERLRSALYWLPSDDRVQWISFGMAIKAKLGDAGFMVWREWSAKSREYDDEDIEKRWNGLKPDGRIGLGTIFQKAMWAGWQAETGAHGASRGSTRQAESETPPEPEPPPDVSGVLEFDTDIKFNPKVTALVKGVLPRGVTAILYGATGSGKSFLIMSLGYHLALGKDWHGYRVREPVPVLYCPYEGVAGVPDRMLAAKGEYGTAGPMLARHKVPLPLQKGKHGDVGQAGIIEAAKLLEQVSGKPVGLIIVDTVSPAMGGDEENNNTDVAAFISRLAAIAEVTGATVVGVHHPGKDDTKGMRGGYAFEGNSDVVLHLDVQGDARMLVPQKVRDGAVGAALFAFRLKRVVLGYDDDKDEKASCVVEPCDTPQGGGADALTPMQQRLFELLHLAGQPLTTKEWNQLARDDDLTTRKQTLIALRKALHKKGLVYEGANGWSVKQP